VISPDPGEARAPADRRWNFVIGWEARATREGSLWCWVARSLGQVLTCLVYRHAHAAGGGAGASSFFSGIFHSASWAIAHGPIALAIHAALGLAIVVGALHNFLWNLRWGTRGTVWATGTGLLLVLAAALNGSAFLAYDKDLSSLLMALSLGAALLCYAITVYLGVPRHAAPSRQRQEVSAMTKSRSRPGEPEPTLAQRLAGMTIAEIDAMSDREVAELMGATEQEIATEPAWTWREAAKTATSEYAGKLSADVESGQATVITDPAEIRRRLGGRPRVGGEPGEGPSRQVRVRVTTRTRAALEAIAAAQGRRLADVSRDALNEYVARHAS
jgi:hypothetical protein